jgi:hypothetical protein
MRFALALMAVVTAGPAAAQQNAGGTPPMLTGAEARALAAEISGASAKRTVQALSLHHRSRGSEGFRSAAEIVRDKLGQYGLKEVEMIRVPADGKVFYGTQRSRPAWNASFAELWEQRLEGGRWADRFRIASWADQPITLAQDSVSGKAEGELIDVGAGISASDYAGKDLRGRLVLTSSQPEAVARLAVTERGAGGIVSWAQNQRQAWWGDDETLIRWGRLSTWEDPAFAFMVSPAQARAWQERLARGETVRLRAQVEAGRSTGAYLIPTAVIPGRDRSSEIVFSCHLDHHSPGANDNASGCSGVLEIARTLTRLVSAGQLPKPERTIRFIWPAEIEGTIALLHARPEFARRTLATIHLDMIGGDTEITKGSLRVEGSPPSLPSFVGDIGFAIARWVNAQSLAYHDRGVAAFPLIDASGGKRALQAKVGGFSEGSDHQIWAEGSWRIPVLYLADWPDLYIHTHKDAPGNLDATKMKRAMFIAAASAWVLANLDQERLAGLSPVLGTETLERAAEVARRAEALGRAGGGPAEQANLWRHFFAQERAIAASLARFGPVPPKARDEANRRIEGLVQALAPVAVPQPASGDTSYGLVYRRAGSPKGPMTAFGYSWFDDQLEKRHLERPTLLSREPTWDGPTFGYETLNLVDGRRTIGQICDDLAATVGFVPVEEVAQYLGTLERMGLLERSRP